MSKKQILGLILVSPVVLTLLYVFGMTIYAFFEYYPKQMVFLSAFIAFMVGINLLKSEGT